MTTVFQPAANLEPQISRRRWFQFSLRTWVIIAILFSPFLVWLASISIRVIHQRDIIAKIKAKGGSVVYDYQYLNRPTQTKAVPPGPKYVRWIIGEDAFANVETVLFNGAKSTATDSDLDMLVELPHLKAVVLSGKFTENALGKLTKLPDLQEISLSVFSLNHQSFEQIEKLKNLTHLHFFSNTFADDSFTTISTLSNLRSIQFINCKISTAGLSHLAQLTELTHLDFFRTSQIDDEGLKAIGKLSKLQMLRLCATELSDNGMQHLAKLQELMHLHLQNNTTTDHGLEQVAKLSKLQVLYLDGKQISDVGIGYLATAKLPLNQLTICNTQITDKAVDSIQQFPDLEILDIYDTQITDQGLKRLTQLKKLRQLTIYQKVRPETATFLKDQMPNCWINVTEESDNSKNQND